MPLAFLAIGALFLIAAIRGTVTDKTNSDGSITPGLTTLLISDFTGPNNFLIWLLALWVLGALGYIPGFKGVANALLVLVIVVLIIVSDNKSGGGGFFTNFNSAIKAA